MKTRILTVIGAAGGGADFATRRVGLRDETACDQHGNRLYFGAYGGRDLAQKLQIEVRSA